MTQEITADISQDNVSSGAFSAPEQSITTTAPVTEKMLPQSQVNKIAETIRVGKDKRIQELESQIHSLQSQISPSTSYLSANTVNNSLTTDDISSIVDQKLSGLLQQAQQAEQEQAAKNVVESFTSNMLKGKERYQDFDDIAKDINYQAIPNLVQAIANNNIDIDTFYALAKDKPLEIMNIEYALKDQPAKARAALSALASSVKLNEQAKNVQRPNEPIRQLTPSNIGINDGSDLSVGDFKKLKPWRT